MSRFTVLTQPQQVFPFGLQHDLVITNDGPSTVWLGDDSSISTDQNLGLPPLASVHWSAGEALWAVTDAHAELRITHAVDVPTTPGDGKIRVLTRDYFNEPQSASGAHVLEVGAYKTLYVYFKDGFGVQDDYELSYAWYVSRDPSLVAFATTDTTHFKADGGDRVRVLVIPVQGPYFVFTSVPASMTNAPVLIAGSTFEDGPSFAFNVAQPTEVFASGGGILSGQVQRRYTSWLMTTGTYANLDFNLPSVTQKLHVHLRFSVATTTGVSVFVHEVGDATRQLFTTAVAVGATSTDFDVILPPLTTCCLRFSGDFGAAVGVAVTLTWSD